MRVFDLLTFASDPAPPCPHRNPRSANDNRPRYTQRARVQLLRPGRNPEITTLVNTLMLQVSVSFMPRSFTRSAYLRASPQFTFR